jgi:hypothetical protein
MKLRPSSYHTLLLAGVAGLALYAGPLAAQQTPAAAPPATQAGEGGGD